MTLLRTGSGLGFCSYPQTTFSGPKMLDDRPSTLWYRDTYSVALIIIFSVKAEWPGSVAVTGETEDGCRASIATGTLMIGFSVPQSSDVG